MARASPMQRLIFTPGQWAASSSKGNGLRATATPGNSRGWFGVPSVQTETGNCHPLTKDCTGKQRKHKVYDAYTWLLQCLSAAGDKSWREERTQRRGESNSIYPLFPKLNSMQTSWAKVHPTSKKQTLLLALLIKCDSYHHHLQQTQSLPDIHNTSVLRYPSLQSSRLCDRRSVAAAYCTLTCFGDT